MNPLAMGLLGLRPLPGAVIHVAKFPPVSHELFGMKLSGSIEQRRRMHAIRLDGEERYLRANGPMTTTDLAEAFGIIPEAMVKDVRILSATGRIRRVDDTKPTQWEVTP